MERRDACHRKVYPGKQGVHERDVSAEAQYAGRASGGQPCQEAEAAEEGAAEAQLPDEKQQDGELGEPCGPRRALCAPPEGEDEEGVEQHIHNEACAADEERYARQSGGIVDTGERGGEHGERHSRGNHTEVVGGIAGNLLLHAVEADYAVGKEEKHRHTGERDDEGERHVVRGEGVRLVLAPRADAL